MIKKRKETKFIKFAKSIIKRLRSLRISLYSNKFSKKVYTQWQHIILLALRQLRGMGYWGFVKELPDYTALLEFLKLNTVPHATTLQKAAERFKGTSIERIVEEYIANGRKKRVRFGIDSTGFSLNKASHYYVNRLEHYNRRKRKKRRPGRPRKKRKVKKHLKDTIFVDLDKQLIATSNFCRGPRDDYTKLKPPGKKLVRFPQKKDSVDADKGYDANYNFEFVEEELKAKPYIKLRNMDVPVHRTKGAYRKKAKGELLNKRGRPRKNHRNKNETVFSVIKRVMGEHVYALRPKMQNQELRFRHLAYNAYREISFLFIEVFYRAFSAISF